MRRHLIPAVSLLRRITGDATVPVRALLGLVVFAGFLISPTGLSNLFGQAGTSVAIGQGIQVIGVVTALLAGVLTTRANYRNQAPASP